MLKLSLLNKDLRTTPEKILDRVNKIHNEKKENDLLTKPMKINKSYDNILSKTGLGNTMRGSREVINHQNSLKESSMGIKIPIKQIILEFTADHIRDNAGKYAAGTMLGLGAAAGYLAGDPEHGAGLIGDNSPATKVASNFSNLGNNQSDFQKDLAQHSSTTTTNYHNQDKGLIGNLWGGLKQGAHNLQAENKFNDLTDAQRDYEEIKNNEGSLLTGGQKAALGAGALGTGFLATKMRRR